MLFSKPNIQNYVFPVLLQWLVNMVIEHLMTLRFYRKSFVILINGKLNAIYYHALYMYLSKLFNFL